MIAKLLSYLAQRQHDENALSDVTWAACSASPSLLQAFLSFFFPKVAFDRITAFEREYAQRDSRPDFYIRNGEDIYLVENKIYDQNHHFDQYISTFGIPAERLGYISNYPMVEAGCTVHTWDEFYHHLQHLQPEDAEERELWRAYLEYVKNVCSICERPEKMDLKGMYSLYVLMKELSKLVNNQTDTYTSEYYNSRGDTHQGGNIQGSMRDGIAGCYFHVKYANDAITECRSWIGVYYERKDPLFCICFEDNPGWGKSVCDLLTPERISMLPAGNFYGSVYSEDGHLWFDLSDAKLAAFQTADFDGQIALLKGFLDEVVTIIKTITNN